MTATFLLLLDYRDALWTESTEVPNSNDRMANLQNNFRLRRLGAFDGILILTTNQCFRIDPTFLRRMDGVLLQFFDANHQPWPDLPPRRTPDGPSTEIMKQLHQLDGLIHTGRISISKSDITPHPEC